MAKDKNEQALSSKAQNKIEEGMDWLGEVKEDIMGDDNQKPGRSRGRKGGRSRSKKSKNNHSNR